MAKRIEKNITDAFSAALNEKDDWQTEVNLRKFVENSFFSIENAVKNKATWKQIAEVLQGFVGESFEVKADTVRQYYGDAVKKRDELVKVKQRSAKKKGTSKKKTADKNATTINASAADSEVNSVQRSAGSPKSFLTRSRGNQSTHESPQDSDA